MTDSKQTESIELSEYSGWQSIPCTITPEDSKLFEPLKKAKVEILPAPGGINLRTGCFVGHLTLCGRELIIKPKLEQLQQENGNELLLSLFRYAFDLDQIKIVGEQNSSGAFYEDILLTALLDKVAMIQRRGPFQQYQKRRKEAWASSWQSRLNRLVSQRWGPLVNVTLRLLSPKL